MNFTQMLPRLRIMKHCIRASQGGGGSTSPEHRTAESQAHGLAWDYPTGLRFLFENQETSLFLGDPTAKTQLCAIKEALLQLHSASPLLSITSPSAGLLGNSSCSRTRMMMSYGVITTHPRLGHYEQYVPWDLEN